LFLAKNYGEVAGLLGKVHVCFTPFTDAAGKPSRMDGYGERASVMIGKKNGTHH
jgi:hypothetical protein